MTTAEKTLKWWNDYLKQNKTYPLVAEIEMQLNLAVDNEKQVKNIKIIPCCKKDSELLLFSSDEIVSKINEQTVLDGETFRDYFREK